MLKLSWLLTLMTAGFEYIWSRTWSPMIEAPAISAPTSVLIAALFLFTVYRGVITIKRKLDRHELHKHEDHFGPVPIHKTATLHR